ncbi:MAG: alkaline phosphatase family protein [Desulfobacterales bacterium]|nr:MAG: alkaline phosphatase family protein [Desulfobacterales bacterium]
MADRDQSKILIIGLDMGDGNLIRQWAEEGYLPALSRMIKQGTWADLKTTAEVLHVSAWPSLYTGTLPGDHGVYYTYQAGKSDQVAKRIGIGQYGKPPIWKILDEAGKRCIVMDTPYTFPEEGYNGIQIFEWGTWAWYWKPMAVPAGLWRKLKSSCGTYPLGYEANQIGLGSLDPQKLRDALLSSVRTKGAAVQWLLAEYPWDFAWTVFGETHPAGHYLGDFGSSVSAASQLGRDVYQAIDTAIGKIVDDYQNNVTLFIVSGDGVGRNYAGWHLLPEILKQTGYLVDLEKQPADEIDQPAAKTQPQKDRLKQLRSLIPRNLREMVSKRLPAALRDKLMARWAGSEVDWSRTHAYCLPTDLEGCIRINLRGREPEGIVEPGEAYRALCDEIAALISGLVHTKTGSKAVRAVYKMHETFGGERMDDLPDIVVQWENDAAIDALSIPETGITVKGESPDWRSGTHVPPGFMLAKGGAIFRGQTLSGCHVTDLAPTILKLMDVAVPTYMKGQVWEEII